ncbi:hypothetical protein ABS768_02015 [Flavobacterium sp. ST-75]|uniref:YhhN-like protein n=1 Tax=Flavobacterium rhizophilum TaxID=3163296 RepID=A0ABW8Y8H9_9FLAO
MNISTLLANITFSVPIILIFGLGIGIYYYKFIKREYQLLLLYLGICLITDIISRILGVIYGNNLIFIVIFSFLELLFFSIYYQLAFFKRRIWVYTIISSIALMFIAWEIVNLWNVPPSEFQSYSRVISGFFIIAIAINYLFEKIEEKQKQSTLIKLNYAFIIFYSLHLIFFLPINFLINVPSSIKYYFWLANLLLTLTFYVYLGREIWRNGLTQKRLHSGL